jgi:hypothetical protein
VTVDCLRGVGNVPMSPVGIFEGVGMVPPSVGGEWTRLAGSSMLRTCDFCGVAGFVNAKALNLDFVSEDTGSFDRSRPMLLAGWLLGFRGKPDMAFWSDQLMYPNCFYFYFQCRYACRNEGSPQYVPSPNFPARRNSLSASATFQEFFFFLFFLAARRVGR